MGRGKALEPNTVTFHEDIVYIHLRGKHGEGLAAIVDVESYFKHKLRDYIWTLDKVGYVVARDTKRKKPVSIHRIVAGNTTRNHTDHINQNPFDNRKENLRICNAVENNFNTGLRVDNKSGYKNVRKANKKFVCTMRIQTNKQYFGCYEKPEMAALAYNIVIKLISPEFAVLNDIPQNSLTSEEIEKVHNTVNERLEKINKKYDLLG